MAPDGQFERTMLFGDPRPLQNGKTSFHQYTAACQFTSLPRTLGQLGYSTMAYIGIFLDKAMANPRAVKELEKIPEVLECHYTTGNWSILIKVLCKDNEHLMQVLNKHIQQIEGVSRTETFISLDQQIDRQIQI